MVDMQEFDQAADRFSALTRAVRSGIDTDPANGAVVPPINLSTNYSFTGYAEPRGYDYSRAGNPTRQVFADAITALEGGSGTVITSSGLSAVTTAVLSVVTAGARVAIPHDAYGGTWRLFDNLARRGYCELHTVDFTAADTAAARLAELQPDLVFLETPSNPLLRITDLTRMSAAAHAAGALVVADNTFCSPLLQQPLSLGADLVLHSTTKYINGHSDMVGGSLTAATPQLAEEISYFANVYGCTGGAFDAYLGMRGLRTLHTRMRAHQENAAAVVEVLLAHPAVRAVYYPGLPEHPGHELAARQQSGFGAMVSFELAGVAEVKQLLPALHCFTLAESLGGTESLISHTATMTHAGMTEEARKEAGITDGLLRLSVGIEATEDLVDDLRTALDAVI